MSAASPSLGAARRNGDHVPLTRKLSLFPQSIYTTTEYAANAATVRARTAQFDICHVRSLDATHKAFSGAQVVTQSAVQAEADALHAADFGSMRFLLHFRTGTGMAKFDNNAHWTNMASNLTKIANVYRNSPYVVGLFWDIEYYGYQGTPYWLNYPVAGDLAGLNLAQARDKAAERFHEAFTALFTAWPEVNFVFAHGVGTGFPEYHAYFGTGGWTLAHNDVSWANELQGMALAGAAAANADLGNTAVLYDGAELYGTRTRADAQRIGEWEQHRIKTVSGAFNRYGVAKYKAAKAIGTFDKSDYPATQWQPLNEATIEAMLREQLKEALFVWFYSEIYNWVGAEPAKPTPSTALLNAVANARTRGRL